MKQNVRRKLALLIIGALFVGMIPVKNQTVSKAEQREQVSHELNNPRTDSDGTVTWDCVYFGNYWQEDTNGNGTADQEDAKQPIKWRVLSVDGDDAFLLADKNLDVALYNDNMGSGAMWETSTLRSWLNGYGAEANKEGIDYSGSGFLDAAFTSEEKSAINATYVVNDDNPIYDAEGGNDTIDQVYLLSIEEAMDPAYGFILKTNQTETRQAQTTAYAIGKGASVDAGPARNSDWWLRSPGEDGIRAALVRENGHVGRRGSYVYGAKFSVRPVLHLNLKATSDAISTLAWSYAGTVIAKGIQTVPIPPVPTPEATVPPVLSTATASAIPNISPTTEASEKPELTASTIPVASEKPGMTASPAPMGSEKPEATGSPVPAGSEKPEATGSPVPAGSEKPGVTASPNPVDNENPKVTGSPIPEESEKPEVTGNPIPAESEKPEVTASPIPAESEKPKMTASASPTQMPENPTKSLEPNAVDDKDETSPSVGTVLGDSKNKVSYKVIGQNKTVAFYKAKNEAATKVVIPATVTLDGVKYKVNAISDQAFKGCKKLKSVTIGKNITNIGKKAFNGCSKLKSITIKSKKLKNNSIGAGAFKGIHKKAVIQVPKKQKKTYQKWLRKKGTAKTVKIK